jgi:DNA-binding beta-propeller fold protein YncE
MMMATLGKGGVLANQEAMVALERPSLASWPNWAARSLAQQRFQEIGEAGSKAVSRYVLYGEVLMSLTDDDLVPVDPEEFADLDSDPTLPLEILDPVLNRPLSWRKRRFSIGLALLSCFILLVLLWPVIVPQPRRIAASRATTAIPLTPTPTLGIAGRISATIPIGAVHEHTSIAASATAVWVHDGPTGTVTRIDPRTNSVVATIAVGGTHGGTIAIGQQAVWVTEDATGIVSRIDPQSNHVTATIQLTPGTGLLGVSSGTVWVINVPNNTLTKIDEQTNRVVATLSTPLLPIGVSSGDGSVWVCSRHGGTAGVTRLDPQTNQVQAQIDVGSAHALVCNGDIIALAQAVWVPIFDELNPLRQHLLERIDPATNKVTDFIELGADMNPDLVADERGVWVCDPTTGLYRVDPQRRRVIAQVQLPGGDSLALGAGSLWLTRTSDNTVVRITPAP